MNYQKMLEQIKLHEGLRLKPYKCTAGYLTIGYGRNLESKGISADEAEEMLLNDVSDVEQSLARHELLSSKHNDARRAVVINMAFNLGVAGLLAFKKTLDAYRNQQYLTASIEMLDSKWAKQVGMRAKVLSEQMRTGEWQ
uniref:glycoside hydrolase family protein n=1 Tax=Ningiella ruwaisensis TaxID=2364274 RepID=UPI0010A07AFC|nr:glycoside hydrolase family protein [Ningiella ruwaisensis]